jgi:hypothetical protein
VEEGEFDFQAALAGFDKDAEMAKLSLGDGGGAEGGGAAPTDDTAVPTRAKYNAKSSFFDEVSPFFLCSPLHVSDCNCRSALLTFKFPPLTEDLL